MLVIIATIMFLTSCAGGAFVCFHPDCYTARVRVRVRVKVRVRVRV
jgi:hypothetical protein